MTKDEVREKSKILRAELSFRDEKNCKITRNVLKLLQGKSFNSLFLYASMGSEVDTYALAEAFSVKRSCTYRLRTAKKCFP